MKTERETARPDWSDVSRWQDARNRVQAMVADVAGRGFTVVEKENGFSVAGDTQVAIFTVTAGGFFRWGWVQYLAGGGRTDFEDWDSFIAALTGHTPVGEVAA